MKTLIVGNGHGQYEVFYNSFFDTYDSIIGVDGGLEWLKAKKITPHLMVGDMDSVSAKTLAFYEGQGVPCHRANPVKDYTDVWLAIDMAIENQATEIHLINVTGGRIDHTLTNLYLLSYIAKKGVLGKMITPTEEIFLVEDTGIIQGKIGDTISLLPLGGDVILSTEGFYWDLKDRTLSIEEPIGVSNVLRQDCGTIHVKKGRLLIIKNKNLA